MIDEIISHYHILEKLGEGGMGVVYEAEQTEPARRVTLKVPRGGGGASRLHHRLFQREIEILARLRHASIAQIYDAGQTHDGQQFFAMELVGGHPLIEYGEMAELSLRERLGLFVQVCRAVNYAHQRGVIHRDLKPANILVDDDGVPRILDFGLARFVEPDVGVARSATKDPSLMGTLPYMSPEQTRGDAAELDIRTDVYSLGVVLYELLTGRFPYEVQGRLSDVLHNIAEVEPTRPSSLDRRTLDPPHRERVGDEVETILLRALAKAPDRRYQSADGLADDLERFLRDEPILAKRPSRMTHARKWVRRHRAVTALGTLTALVCIMVLVGGWAMRRERLAQLRTAGKEAVAAAQLSLDAEEYGLAVGLLTEARKRLDEVSEATVPERRQIDERLTEARAGQNRQRFRRLVREARSYAYFNRELAKVKPLCEEALRIIDVPNHVAPADEADRAQPAEQLPEALRGDAFELLLILARAQFYAAPAKDEQAKAAALEEALATLDQAQGLRPESPGVHLYRASFLKRSGNEAEARAEEDRAGKLKPQTALDHYLLGVRARGEDQISHYKTVLRLQPDHVISFLHLGQCYGRKQPEKAVLCYTAVLALLPDDEIRGRSVAYMFRGDLHLNVLGDPAKALADYTAARRLEPDRWSFHSFCGGANHDLGRYKEAVDDYTNALTLVSEGFKPALGELYVSRGATYEAWGRFAEAAADFDRAVQAYPRRFNNEVAWRYVAGSRELRNPKKALPLAEAAVKARPKDAQSLNTLGVTYYRLGRWEEARERLKAAIQANPDGGTAWDSFFLAMAHWQLDEKDEARQRYDQAVGWMKDNPRDGHELRHCHAEAVELLGISIEDAGNEVRARGE